MHCLTFATKHSIPQIPNQHLNIIGPLLSTIIKQDTIDAHNLWVSAGRPRSGSIFYLTKRSKYRFKLGVKDSAHAFENKYSNDLHECLISEDLHSFWKTWNLKVYNKKLIIADIGGESGDVEIAEIFKTKFSKRSDCADSLSGDDISIHNYVDAKVCDARKWLFSVDDVDTVVLTNWKEARVLGVMLCHLNI